eukprot:scaffold8526_cov153-Amphora_coffeaeformis.AAC.3
MDSQQQLYFQSIYPFGGDASAHQLSFPKGAILRVQPQHATAGTGGWTWGCITDPQSGEETLGWFPTGYAVLTTPPPKKPVLPWVQQQQVDDRDDGDFTGGILGGESPALDYSSAPAFDSGSNPFTKESTGPLDHLRGDDRITIVATTSNNKGEHKLGKVLHKGWQKVGGAGKKVGAASAKLLHRRRPANEDHLVPSISVNPSSAQ